MLHQLANYNYFYLVLTWLEVCTMAPIEDQTSLHLTLIDYF